jgi:LmbE family N-acetylglucosaminyl deacetylase
MNPTKLTRTTLFAAALLAAAGNAALRAQATGGDHGAAAGLRAPVQAIAATEYRGAVALGLELRRMGTTGRILMIGAHPDDENNPMLTRLALGEGATVAYLSLTRGEGGQNAIGADFQEALGILRSEELLAARRLDAAGQFFGREYDFGFSKTAAESFQHWPREAMLSDVVRIIRLYRPDVVISVWTGTPRDGHGQHQVSGIVAREAFDAAADPSRFPEQLREGLAPWAPKKLYEGAYFTLDSATVRLATGQLDPLLGMSYAQVAGISRARHRSQDQGQALALGPRVGGLRLVIDRSGPTPAGPHPESGLFQGMDTTLAQRAATALGGAAPAVRLFAAYDSAALAARAAFDPLRPDALVPVLARAVRALAAAESALPDSPAGAPLRAYAADAVDAADALADAAGLVFDAVASREQVVPGDSVDIDVTAWNGGSRPVTLDALSLLAPAGWPVTPMGARGPAPLAPGTLETRRFRVLVPADAPVTEPYYLRLPRQGDLYTWPTGDPADGLPFQPPPIRASGSVTVEGATVPFELPAAPCASSPRCRWRPTAPWWCCRWLCARRCRWTCTSRRRTRAAAPARSSSRSPPAGAPPPRRPSCGSREARPAPSASS